MAEKREGAVLLLVLASIHTLWKPCAWRLPPGGAVGRLDRRNAPVAGSPRDARTRTLAGLQCRDVVVLARLSDRVEDLRTLRR